MNRSGAGKAAPPKRGPGVRGRWARRVRWLGRCGLLGLLLSAPAAAGTEDSAGALRERAQAYWDAQVKGDWKAVYSFLPPAERAGMSEEQFVAKQQAWVFRYLAVELAEAQTAENLGWVQVNYTIEFKRVDDKLPAMEPKRLQVWEPWRLEDAWYVIPRERRDEAPRLPPQRRSAAEEAALKQRVAGYWQARQRQDWAQAYQYMEPAYREKVSREDFLQRKSLYDYLSYRLEWVEAIGDQGRVRIAYTLKANDPSLAKLDPEERVFNENWIKVNDEWYFQAPK